jgi:hypothetical protein
VNRGDAYKILADRLNALRSAGYVGLLSRVDQPAIVDRVSLHGEEIELDIVIRWADQKRRRLQICGSASGPSTWMTQRLEESFVIGPDDPAT